jgi:cyclopropane fatty-acyl-phospholipid synthase-like methyltransferase
MAKSTNEEQIDIPYNLKQWQDYPVGTYKKNTKGIKEAIETTMGRLTRIVPSIKKSSKLLVFSSGSSYVPIYLAVHSGCKIECIANSDKASKKIVKDVKELGLEDNITVASKPFSKTLFHRNTFDMVWSVAESYQDDEALDVFREVARVLVPEGRYILCHQFRSEENDHEDFAHLAIVENFLHKASNVDLERVYVKELKNETVKHLKAFLKHKDTPSKEKKILEKFLDSSELDQLVWAFLVFQKRNI